MVEKKGLKLGEDSPKLTEIEKEVLYLFTKEFLTIKKVAIKQDQS